MALGRSIIVAQDDALGGFAALCVTEQRSLSINNEQVDITKPDCTNPGGKLRSQMQYGVQSLAYTGSGAFVNIAAQKTAVANAFNQVVETYQIEFPDIGTFVGDGLISVTLSGDKTNELQNEISIAMSGEITFTPAT